MLFKINITNQNKRIVMNKIFLLISLSLVFFAGCNSEKKEYNFKAEITVKDAQDSGYVYFKNWEKGKWVAVDSAMLLNGKTEIKGSLNAPTLYFFFYNNLRVTPIFVEPGEIKINTDKNNLRYVDVEGSESQKLYENFMRNVNIPIDQKISVLGNKYNIARKKGDMNAMDSITKLYEDLESNRRDSMIIFAKENSKSVVPAFLIYQFAYQFSISELEEAANSFDPSLNDVQYVKSIKERIATLKRVQIGQPYLDFTENDTSGNPVSLASVVEKNKYVLVDFWAAWCNPCRIENPNILDAYNKYHNKGFTVFGVSFDKERDKWIKAINDDGLIWTQVSDLNGWENKAAKLYGIQSIPQNVLIGPEGKIIARNIRGKELQDKLKELMP
jgi:peroxiredoxin